MTFLFLYTEIADYFLACLHALSSKKDVEIHVVKWPVNKEAPFKFTFSEKIKWYEKDSFNKKELLELTKNISPDLIYCSGWIDKEYLFICKRFRNKIPVVAGFDNKWKGSLKQQLGAVLSSFIIR